MVIFPDDIIHPLSDEESLPDREVHLEGGRGIGHHTSTTGREAPYRGYVGNDKRRRWNNDRLIGHPNATPPQSIDMLPHPTYWPTCRPNKEWTLPSVRDPIDQVLAYNRPKVQGPLLGHIPRALKPQLKKSPPAQDFVRGLEEQIREFTLNSPEDTLEINIKKEYKAATYDRWLLHTICGYYNVGSKSEAKLCLV